MDCSLQGSSLHGIFRQEYWSGMPFPSPGHLPNPGIEPRSPTLQADSLPTEPPGKPKSERESCSFMSDSLRPHGLYSPWNFPGQTVEWAAVPLSRTSSQSRYQTHVSCIAGGFFTSWGQEDVSSIPSSCERGIGKCPLGGKISWLKTTGIIPSYLLRKLAVLVVPLFFSIPSTSTPMNSYCLKNFYWFLAVLGLCCCMGYL